MSGDADSLGVVVWRGGVHAWECDVNGHMNVRFYLEREMEALAGAAAALGMPRAFTPGAASTLMIREQHLRFLKEAAPRTPLHIRVGVLSIDEAEAMLLLAMYHSVGGEPAATFTVRVSHVTAAEGRPFPWPRQTLEYAEALRVALPAYAAPRSLPDRTGEPQASLERAKALGLSQIALGAVRPKDCDVFGRMSADQFVIRVSDGVPVLSEPIRQQIIAESARRVGGAVLEYRIRYFDWPRAGDHLALWSGLEGIDRNSRRFCHWLLDPYGGKLWGVGISVGVAFDLDSRRLISTSAESFARFQAQVIPGLTF